ncbi:hypothetical protein D9758_012464 [Tetrapyrgos nigripes]|uniref:Probable beta-glucosidase G n=1 Tax=Tetrapyrgos nigripes TaxID=182062 RepID=A0A8H5FUN5_9AGAR|nr:hypothetical protein D9758_012464 [Tetrapyrgos nigripes]
MKFDTVLAFAIALFVPQAFADNFLDIASLDSGNGTRWSAPALTGGKSWSDAFAKASALVANMTLEEKVNITTGIPGRCVGNTGGVPRLGIEGFCLEDGPAGVRPVHGVSQFAVGLAAAASWDEELIYKRSLAMGQEYYDEGVHIALAPVTGGPLGRAPRMGRNWEGWYADAYATGVASYLSVKGLQDSGVAATAKHFIGYEQETFRNQFNYSESYAIFPTGEQRSISSNIDDKTTHEVYLWSFAESVRAGASHVMCSYNEVNQTQSCHNAYTQNHLLKKELAFQGSIMLVRLGGQHDNTAAALGGMDLSMPGSGFGSLFGSMWGPALVELVRNGTVPEERVTDSATRVLIPWVWLGQDKKKLPPVIFNGVGRAMYDVPDEYRDVRKEETAELIRTIGSNGATLLKNTGVLPLQNPQRIAVLGNDATGNALGTTPCGGGAGECPRDNLNGTMSMGGGSGAAYAPYIVTPLDALKKRAIDTDLRYHSRLRRRRRHPISPSTADVTLVFVHAWASEGYDRKDTELDEHMNNLIASAVNSSSNVVLVMHIPGVVNIEKWVENDNVTAIVAAWYPGQESGNGLVDVLYGDVNPSGSCRLLGPSRMMITMWPGTIVEDKVTAPQSNFTEGVFVDYRYFDAKNITPRYEFGFGLSYTTFAFSDISIDESAAHPDELAIQDTAEAFADFDGSNSLYDVLLSVSATVTNSGNVTGSEVAQLYLTIPEDDQPPRVLRGFNKVKDIAPGASKTATFELRRKDLSVSPSVLYASEVLLIMGVNVNSSFLSSGSCRSGTSSISNGTSPRASFGIHVGSSSRDLPLETTWTKSS